MNPHTGSTLTLAAIDLIPTVVWGVIAFDAGRYLIHVRPTSRFFWLLPPVAGLSALHYGAHALLDLTPTELAGRAPGLHLVLHGVIVVAMVGSLALLRHMVPLLPVREERPGRRWLLVNYGSAVAVIALAIASLVVGPERLPPWLGPDSIATTWVIVVGALSLRQLRQLARRGAWRPGPFELSSPDVVIIGLVVPGSIALMAVSLASSSDLSMTSSMHVALHTALGLALAVPFLVRMLGEAIRMLLMVAAAIAIAVAVVALHPVAAGLPDAESRRVADLALGLALILALGPGRAWLQTAIDRLVLRRSRHQRIELQAFLDRLSPELGPRECCRQALGELTRVMQIPNAAILLANDDEPLVRGVFDLGALRRAWPRDGAGATLVGGCPVEPRELPHPVREALVDATVVWVAAIASPRRHWGHVLATEGFVRGRVCGDGAEVVAAFVGQLARVLDGAELLARAVAVERSLAHAEKLAAIGEVSARIAHEIRNPVTAARSLAQQLAREPASPFATEHGLILAELERVERQVAALLRFARREDFRFAPVDLGDLVRATAAAFRTRLEVGGVALDLHLADGLIVRADAEKVRQVLVNLLENALDALAAGAGGGGIDVTATRVDGTASVRVADTGPGVPADALPHLFEPFFSLKPAGTGLGLAIARRTVEAHGGRIGACSAPTGMTFEITLPLGGAEPR